VAHARHRDYYTATVHSSNHRHAAMRTPLDPMLVPIAEDDNLRSGACGSCETAEFGPALGLCQRCSGCAKPRPVREGAGFDVVFNVRAYTR